MGTWSESARRGAEERAAREAESRLQEQREQAAVKERNEMRLRAWAQVQQARGALARAGANQRLFQACETLAEPLGWQNSTVLHGGVAGAVAALKQEEGADLHVIGSTRLVQTLISHNLADEFRLMIDPVLLGGGKRIFPDNSALRPLQLTHSQVTATGAVLATYARATG